MIISYVQLFLGFGLIGWVIDTSYRYVTSGIYKPATIVPYFASLYGISGVAVLLIYQLFPFNAVWQVVFGGIAITLIELFGGLFCVHLLKEVLWDYSENKLNFRGLIDAQHTCYWFFLAAILRFII